MNSSERILTQILGVSQRRDQRGNEGLVYAPALIVDDGRPAPEPLWRPIKTEVLFRHVEAVRKRVEELTWLERCGHARGAVGIEPEAQALARYLLPEQGFVHVIEPGIHPRFDIVFDAASEIPWEVLEEHYLKCDCQGAAMHYVRLNGARDVTHYCQFCGKPMRAAGGKLALERHLTHLVRGGVAPSGSGDEFVIIADPTGDLRERESDPHGAIARHLEEIATLLESLHYVVNVISGPNATTRRVLDVLASPSVLGLYYFGHGLFPQDSDQGCLVLADAPLFAGEIEEVNSNIRFAFLNACEGGAPGRDWTLEKKFRSVGHALARGGPSKTVVAPLWPVVAAQAAQTALDFFRNATGQRALALALQAARLKSHAQYEEGRANISWMAYRYFGDPNRALPLPQRARATSVAGALQPGSSRVFVDDRLDADVFAFDVRDVLLRAAKRRNLQNRAVVTSTDFLAGLMRTGHLTRYAMRQLHADPDALYHALVDVDEDGPSAGETIASPSSASGGDDPTDERARLAQLRRFFSRWIVRDQSQFDDRLTDVWARADETAQSRPAGAEAARISEHDVLLALIDRQRWTAPDKVGIPPAGDLRDWLAMREKQHVVDENGSLLLANLTPGAQRIISAAHELAQQRGFDQVPNRLLLASFLEDPQGHAARQCARLGTNAQLLSQLLIKSTDSTSPTTFVLSPETGAHVVVPLVARARQLQSEAGGGDVSDDTLLAAYSQIAPPEIVGALKSLPSPLRLDLHQLSAGAPAQGGAGRHESSGGAVPSKRASAERHGHGKSPAGPPPQPPPNLCEFSPTLADFDAREIIDAALEYALAQGYYHIRLPHLMAGLVGHSQGVMASVLRRRHVSAGCLVLSFLRCVPAQAAARGAPTLMLMSSNVERIVVAALRRANQQGRETFNELDLCVALFHDPAALANQMANQLGYGWLSSEPFESFDQQSTPDEQRASDWLATWGVDLTAKAAEGGFHPTIGRRKEIGDLLRALAPGSARRALLVGERGVGKTAILQGAASWIAEGICPPQLLGRPLLEVSGRALAGAARFDDAIRSQCAALTAAMPPDSILLVDELDHIVAPEATDVGAEDDPSGAGLHALLSRDDLAIVGTMTPLGDARARAAHPTALDRFEKFVIHGGSNAEIAEVVTSHKTTLESIYRVQIARTAIQRAVDLTASLPNGVVQPGAALAALRLACRFAAGRPVSHDSSIDPDCIEQIVAGAAVVRESP